MSIDFGKAMGLHPQALNLRVERTRVLESNIANENTPGYQARDVDFSALMRRVDARDGAPAFGAGTTDMQYRVPFHPSADGNTVELGVEQAAFSQNASDFQTSLTFLNMKIKGLAKAIAGQ